MADELFDPRLTEHRNPRTRDIDLASPLEIVDLINAEDRTVPEAVRTQREEIAQAIEIAVESFRSGGRLFYVGAGTSGRLGVLDATECPPTFGVAPEMVQGIIAGGQAALTRSQEGAEDRAEEGAAAIDRAGVESRDLVFGIASSSTTPYVRGALARAAELGASTGFLCCTEPGPGMRELVDVCVVPLVGPEVVAGSTRMKAGTATKLVLNTITTGAMIRLGKVYQNLMVDLQAISEKLVDRSQRITMAVTGLTREQAAQLVEAAGGSVKVALVMAGASASRELALLYLSESDGFVRRALARAQAALEAENPYSLYPEAPPDEGALEALRSALRGLARQVGGTIEGATDQALQRRAAPTSWCAKEHIEHLVVCDELARMRISAILSEDQPFLANRDDEAENRAIGESGAESMPRSILLRRLSDGRAALAFLIEGVAASGLTRTGRHERYGLVSVYQILRHLVWHDHRHLLSIRRLVSG